MMQGLVKIHKKPFRTLAGKRQIDNRLPAVLLSGFLLFSAFFSAKMLPSAVMPDRGAGGWSLPFVFWVSFFLWVVYPLNKKKVEGNVEELKQRRGV